MLDSSTPKCYFFEDFKLDNSRKLLLRMPQKDSVALTNKAYEVLLLLVEHHGKLVTKDQLMENVWKDSIVEEANLTQTISVLRKTLGEKPNQHRFIVTESGKGYRFVADVTVEEDQELSPETADGISSENKDAQTENGTKATDKQILYPLVALLLAFLIGGAYFFSYTSESDSQKPNTAKDVKVLAVLPFKNLASNNEEDKLLGVGMADAIITKLSQTKSIVVRQTSSVVRYADSTPEAIKVGREINVDAIVEGNIQRAEGRIRVSVRMYRVNDSALIWAEKFDERESGIFNLQDSISERVANSLALELNPKAKEKLKLRYTENIDAYNLYNKGRFFWNNRNEEDLRKSIELYKKAIEKDENYALAYAGLAETYVLLHTFSSSQEKDAFPNAKRAAEKALLLDPDLAEAHAALALYQEQYEYDWEAAEKEFQKAIEVNPSYATARQWYSEFLGFLGRKEESIVQAEKAFELDPLSLSTNTVRAFPYLAARDYDEAIKKLKIALELDDDFPLALYYLGRCYDGKNLHKQAIAKYKKAIESSGGGTYFSSALVFALFRDGQKDAAQKEFDNILKTSEKRPVSKYVLARSYAAMDKREKALELLEEAFKERDSLMIVIKIEQIFDELRNEPKFKELLRKMDLEGSSD